MRQLLIAILAMLVVPAMADVTITVTDNLDCTVTIGYSTDGEIPRAFALDLCVDGGATIDAIGGFVAGESTVGAIGFGIFPGAFDAVIDPAAPNWADPAYTPVAPAGSPGSAGVIGDACITVELGSLYDDPAEQPGTTGDLLTITVSASCNLSVSANTTRAATGVVLEDTTDATVVLPGATPITCGLPCKNNTYYAQGDITTPGDSCVTFLDAQIIIPAIGAVPGDANYDECADIIEDDAITFLDAKVIIDNLGNCYP
jgi:hypothetical protein